MYANVTPIVLSEVTMSHGIWAPVPFTKISPALNPLDVQQGQSKNNGNVPHVPAAPSGAMDSWALRRAGGGSREREQVDKQVYWWFQVENMVGNPLLSKGVTKGSDPGDGTATAPQLRALNSSWHVYQYFNCLIILLRPQLISNLLQNARHTYQPNYPNSQLLCYLPELLHQPQICWFLPFGNLQSTQTIFPWYLQKLCFPASYLYSRGSETIPRYTNIMQITPYHYQPSHCLTQFSILDQPQWFAL